MHPGLLARRKAVQARLDAGERPHFLGETRRIRESDWKVRCCSQEAFPILCPF